MAGFVRRFGSFPGTEVITQIEGVVIVDLPPPGTIAGVGVGTACLVGEFSDMSSALRVDPATGAVTTDPQPVEIFSSQDLFDKAGGFDETLGEFGKAMGNGFVELRNKRFARLVVVAINLASGKGSRLWRELPPNRSATIALPVVPLNAATVSAGREFKNGADRVKLAQRIVFSASDPRASGTDGVATAAGLPAATRTLTSAGATFVTSGVLEGDAVVPGVPAPAATSVTDNPLLIGAVVINVPSTTGYPSTGTLRLDTELVTYAAITATSFTGVVRGVLATVAAAHVLGTAVQLITDADTYRVVSVDSETQLTIERQDGSNFTQAVASINWIAAVALPFRVHPMSDADTGAQHQLSEDGGYIVPARPLDATIPAATNMNPTVVPTAITATSADPLSGLQMRSHQTSGLVYDADVQAVNAPNDGAGKFNALYSAALDSLLVDASPERDVNLVWCARKSTGNRSLLKQHVLNASERARGRLAFVSPQLNQQTLSTIVGAVDPGVGVNRNERVEYSWPGVVTSVPEAAGIKLATADGSTTVDGVLDVTTDGWLAAVCSNLAPERNPGQAGPPVPTILAPMLGFQRGVSPLNIDEYIALRQAGIAAPRFDRTVGPIFQSGVTTSLISGQKNINRRRMADFIEDSLAEALVQFAKLPLTDSLKDALAGEATAFLTSLLSPDNPAAQRINAFQVDTKSGNTPASEAKGIYVLVVRVRTLATADFIVISAEIGEGVVITTTA